MICQWLRGVIGIKTILKMYNPPCSTLDGHPSAAEETLCLCQVITPVIRFCQLFGMFPVSLQDSSVSRDNHLLHREHCLGSVTNGYPTTAAVPQRDKECHMVHRWGSFPSMTNIFLILTFAGITFWTFSQLHLILTVYFEGTDLYTFGTQTICLYTQCNLILINAILQRDNFCKIWTSLLIIRRKLSQTPSLHQHMEAETSPDTKSTVYMAPSENGSATIFTNFLVASALLHQLGYHRAVHHHSPVNTVLSSSPPFLERNDTPGPTVETRKCHTLHKRLRILQIVSYAGVFTVLVLSISHIISFFNLVFRACFDRTVDPGVNGVFGKPPCPLNNWLYFLQKCFYGMIDFINQGAAILFGTVCLIIYLFFRELEEQLERVLRSFGEITTPPAIQRHYQVEHLRLCYEDLSGLCRLISRSFGLAIISVLITSAVSITCALYSFALYSGAIAREYTSNISKFYVIWAFHGWFGVFCLFIVLVPGQLITNASEAPSQVISRHSLIHLDKETKYQLSQLQHQSRTPIVLTACNIANVGLGFISAAATNVTTYILVILQFRLGVEK